MDKKNKNNIRLVKNGSRRVLDTDNDYSSADEDVTGGEALRRKISYQKKQKERQLKTKRRRVVLIVIALCIIVLILLFLTPIFNIRTISVDGNQIVTQQQIVEKLKPLIGQNLLRTTDGKITDTVKEIPYIDTVDVQKKLFPPSLELYVTEYAPAAIIRASGKNLVVNSSLKVLEELNSARNQLPIVSGVDVESAEMGETLNIGNDYKDNTLKTILHTLETTGLISSIKEININSLTAITMSYEDRISANFGSQLDIERKIRLFKEAVVSDALTNNARGTIDLSDAGKAIYTP